MLDPAVLGLGFDAVDVALAHPFQASHDPVDTADGRQITLSIAGEDHMWSALCGLLELRQFASLNEEERTDRAAEIVPHLREAMGRQPYIELCRRLETLRIAFGPVHRLQDVLADPQMATRAMAVKVDGPNGTQTFVRQPLTFDGVVGAITRPAPGLGQHNAELLHAVGAHRLE
jgi:crotonobetainyl-CoA:carnitine CoA-transferase CaiB-like acyl-CoA transferase